MISMELSPKRIRVIFDKKTIVSSRRALLVGEDGPPVYYFPKEDVLMDALVQSGRRSDDVKKGTLVYWNIRSENKSVKDGAWSYEVPSSSLRKLRDYLAFSWGDMDAWYEEDEEVFVHARDPHKRIDVLKSSRKVKVIVDGKILAESSRPTLLFETGLPTRYYLTEEDFQLELVPTQKKTSCPYKGDASYWSARTKDKTFENIVWGYKEPLAECGKISGLLSFYNEKVDLYVDGNLEEKPKTKWR